MLPYNPIPFFYKEPLLVWEDGQRKIRRPDFTLPTYNNTVIGYTPVKDLSTERYKSVYSENNIAALFLEEHDLLEPGWQQRLYDKLEEIYHRLPAYLGDRHSWRLRQQNL